MNRTLTGLAAEHDQEEGGEVVPFPAHAPMPARRTVVAHRHRCSAATSPLCTRGDGAPSHRSCAHCGEEIDIETGQWAAFHWAMTGEYPLIDAVATFASRQLADEAAEARNLVVRFVPDGGS